MQVWASGKGVAVKPGKDKGKLTVTVAADAAPGVYWLRSTTTRAAGPAALLRRHAARGGREGAQRRRRAGRSRSKGPGVVVNGRLEKRGDVDCFAVEAKKGQTLVASLEANHTLKSPMDAVLQVLSADGFVLEQNHDFHGLDPQVAFTVRKDGTYVVRVFAFPAQPDGSIALRRRGQLRLPPDAHDRRLRRLSPSRWPCPAEPPGKVAPGRLEPAGIGPRSPSR